MRKLETFRELISGFLQMEASGADAENLAKTIIHRTGLMSMLLTDNTPENLSKQENLNELLASAAEFVATRTEEGNDRLSMAEFLGQVSLATDQDVKDADDEAMERVTLMTAHAAKGLEFNNVFIVGVEEELFPSSMSSGTVEGIEEERRLLYVAMTRARKFCMMSYASSRYRNGQTATCKPSRFLHDIDSSLLKLASGTSLGLPRPSFASFRQSYHSAPSFSRPSQQRKVVEEAKSYRNTARPGTPVPVKPRNTAPNPSGATYHQASELSQGMTIEHSRFGLGTITRVDTSQPEARIHVDFENTDSRVLLLKFARFSIIS